MIPRGSTARIALAVAALASVLIHFGTANAAPSSVSDNMRTLTISLPGPFNGCTYLDPGVSATSNAVLDLIRPSAFLTTTNGNLVGEGGPIASAELTSLQPETVVYSVAPHQHWSNGASFDGRDLVAWWQRARVLASVQSDGYRAIKTLTLSEHARKVTAVFATPFSDWNLLFRDVEARGIASGCALSGLLSRPSLGPYRVTNASAARIVLVMNPKWPNDSNRFGRVIVTTGGAIPAPATTPFANYTLTVNRSQEQALSAHPSVLSHIGTSSNIEEITFAPRGALTRSLSVREALSWSLSRQALINQLFGAVTFSPSVAASAIFSQGQSAYPGFNGGGPSSQTTTTTTPSSNGSTPSLADCLTCAYNVLRTAGFRHTSTGWVNADGGALRVHLAVGPSPIDTAAATLVIAQWHAAGVGVTSVNARSDVAAAQMAALNQVDAAIFARPTITAPSFAARSWSGPAYADTYPSGIRSPSVTATFKSAASNFNPVAANATWLMLDQSIMTSFWVRPLFTSPSLVEWANSLTGVLGSLSVSGFLDQETNWNSISVSHS